MSRLLRGVLGLPLRALGDPRDPIARWQRGASPHRGGRVVCACRVRRPRGVEHALRPVCRRARGVSLDRGRRRRELGQPAGFCGRQLSAVERLVRVLVHVCSFLGVRDIMHGFDPGRECIAQDVLLNSKRKSVQSHQHEKWWKRNEKEKIAGSSKFWNYPRIQNSVAR